MRLLSLFGLVVFGTGLATGDGLAFGKRGRPVTAPVGSTPAAPCCGGAALGQTAPTRPTVNLVLPVWGQMSYPPPVWSPSPGYTVMPR